MRTDYSEIAKQKFYYLNYSENTIRVYLYFIDEFLRKCRRDVSNLNSNDFQDYLNNYKFTSISQQNQVINAIRFFYKYVLNKKQDKVDFKRPRKEERLPEIIDKQLLLNKISLINNTKHKCIISLAYSIGLRVSEVLNLKIEDIDSSRMEIRIKQAKGKKDAILPLTENMLTLFRWYYKQYKPVKYMFNGQKGEQYSNTSCLKLVKKYIGKQYRFHSLRHFCATHLLESGVDIRRIQELLRHSSSKTTEIYTKVTTKNLKLLPLAC